MGASVLSIQCFSTTLCDALDGQGDFLTYDGAQWTSEQVPGWGDVGALSCPSSTFCMAGDASGNVWSFDGSWSGPTSISSAAITEISCPTTSFCVAVDQSGDVITFDAGSWGPPQHVASGALDDVNCPTTTFCTAVSATGDVVSYDGLIWTVQSLGTAPIDALSCSTTFFCLAGDMAGNVYEFNGASWSSAIPLDAGNAITSISCPAISTCAAGDSTGNVFFFTAGVLEICNASVPGTLSTVAVGGGTLTFSINGVTQAPITAGFCGSPISEPLGSDTITEAAAPWHTVTAIYAPPGGNYLTSANVSAGTATVSATANTTAVVTFTNELVTGYLEVCLVAATGSGLTGLYSFNIGSNNGFASPPVSVPFGGCSAPIPVPAGTATVAEGGTSVYETGITAVNAGVNMLSDDDLITGTANIEVTPSAVASQQTDVTYTFSSQSVAQDADTGASPDQSGTATASSTDSTTGGVVSATASGTGSVTLDQYAADPPVGILAFGATGAYFDAVLSAASTFETLQLQDCDLQGATSLSWWDPTADGGSGAWVAMSNQSYDPSTQCVTITITADTSPSLSQLTGTVIGIPNHFTQACITSTRTGPFSVASGQSICISSGGKVVGPLTVQHGGALWVDRGSITGPLTTTGAMALTLCDANVTGPVSVQGTSGHTLIGAGDASCARNTITGPVTLANNTGGVELEGNTITGPVAVNGNTGSAAEIEGNRVVGSVSCSGNSPAPVNGGHPNSVVGSRSGQCAGL